MGVEYFVVCLPEAFLVFVLMIALHFPMIDFDVPGTTPINEVKVIKTYRNGEYSQQIISLFVNGKNAFIQQFPKTHLLFVEYNFYLIAKVVHQDNRKERKE